MIVKMKFLSITGPKIDIDRVADKYLKKYEIHLENALSELSAVHDLTPYVEANPYKDLLNQSEELIKKLAPDNLASDKEMTYAEAAQILESNLSTFEQQSKEKSQLIDQKNHLKELATKIKPFISIDFDFQKLLRFSFIKFRFGKIPYEYFDKFKKYSYDNLNTVFFECYNDENYVWGIYFVPASYGNKIDAIFSSLHFERIILPGEYEGTPNEAFISLNNQIKEIDEKYAAIVDSIKDQMELSKEEILSAYNLIHGLSSNFEIRKLAACTKEKQQSFYILCGWIADKDTTSFINDVKNDPNVYCFVEGVSERATTQPPTKLKNPKIFKPFEMFIKMYGLPAYNEIDPTIFVAITYSFMFGMMFGDVGQGLFLVFGGLLLYKIKKMNLAAILASAGIFSTIFGFLYGSIFGYEYVLKPIWVNPMKDTMTVLYTAIGFGVFLIIIAMIMNIINGFREKNIEKTFFDTNGLAGLVFYVIVIALVLLAFTGHDLPSGILLSVGIGIPLLLIFLREPITRFIEKKKQLIPGKKGLFFLESFFELFEIILSFITNTVSFVRVGSFALSHAGMMSVVLMLGKAEESPNFLIIVLGNIFVVCLEGLIVGIQVLRLEYYEMFSRFYKGNGKKFKPYKTQI